MEDIVIRRPRVGDIVLYEGQPHTHIGKVPAIITNVITEVATMDVDLFVFARNDSGVVKSNVPRANIIQPGFYTFIPSLDVRYPYRDGDLLCIGPEVLMHPDGSVIVYKGQMYAVSGNATSRGHLGRLQDRVIELTNLNAELEERHTRDSGTIARLSGELGEHKRSFDNWVQSGPALSMRGRIEELEAERDRLRHRLDASEPPGTITGRIVELRRQVANLESAVERYRNGEQKAVDLLNKQQSFVESQQSIVDAQKERLANQAATINSLKRELAEARETLTELRPVRDADTEALVTPRTDRAIPLPDVDELSPPIAFYPSMSVIVDSECDRVGMFHNGQWLYLSIDNVDLAPAEAAARMTLRGDNYHGSSITAVPEGTPL